MIKDLYLSPREMSLLIGLVTFSRSANAGSDKITISEFKDNRINMPLARAQTLRQLTLNAWNRSRDAGRKVMLANIADKILYN